MSEREQIKENKMTEKPTIDKVTLVPNQPITIEETQQCITYLHAYEPKIIWEVGQKVTAYIEDKIIPLYIRKTEPRNIFIGYLGEDGEIDIVRHQQLGEPPAQAPPSPAFHKQEFTPILTVHRVPSHVEIEIKIKGTN